VAEILLILAAFTALALASRAVPAPEPDAAPIVMPG